MGVLPVEQQLLPEGKLLTMTRVQKHCGTWTTETARWRCQHWWLPRQKAPFHWLIMPNQWPRWTVYNFFRESLIRSIRCFSLPSLYLIFWVYCKLFFARLTSTCKTKCIFCARSSELLSGVSVPDLVNLASMGPNMNCHAGDSHPHQ